VSENPFSRWGGARLSIWWTNEQRSCPRQEWREGAASIHRGQLQDADSAWILCESGTNHKAVLVACGRRCSGLLLVVQSVGDVFEEPLYILESAQNVRIQVGSTTTR
jgi:hypothetical protein